MFRYLIWAWPVALLVMVLYLSLAAIPAMILKLFGLKRIANKWAYINVSFWANFLFRFVNIHVHTSGEIEELNKLKKNNEHICYISNHTSMLDIPIILGPLALNCGFIIKRQMAYVPLINIMALSLNSVFMTRNNIRKSVKSIKRGVKRIEHGVSMLIFPEGTRSKNGEIGTFKRGAFKLAVLSDSYVVPVTIKGIRAAFEDRDRVFKRVDCYLNIGKPINTKGLNRTEIFEMEDTVEKSIKDSYALLGK